MNIDTSLLREKFVIREKTKHQGDNALKIICPSTRMPISLQSGGLPKETYIIRSYNMHSSARMVAKIIHDYETNGPIMNRAIDWAELWESSVSSYDRIHNKNSWIAIYHKGMPIFSMGEYHSFFDVIEKCDVLNKGNYDKSMKMAEKAFRQAGKDTKITCDSTVALISVLGKRDGRCSMVLRGPNTTTTFNYSIKPLKKDGRLNIPQVLSTAADFLEGVQLSHMIGLTSYKLNQGMIEKYSDKEKQMTRGKTRLTELNIQISSMEKRYKVRYRPERPDFEALILKTEKYAEETQVTEDDEIYID
ncbi:MAG: hypothetical protein COB36_04025 [Alphaproteobacteria bacterium]|nr:MAG: hypothetical protein COB36_04025 [Alphaproteobacteria bacterium]